MGEDCRQVVLAHLSQKNNHPEVAMLAAEDGLQRGGRSEVTLELAGASGTDWIRVRSPQERPQGAAAQLRLF